MNPDIVKAKISSFLMEKLEALNEVEFVGFEYENDQKYLAGYGCFKDAQDPVNVIYSIPQKSAHFFFTITEANAKLMASDFAAIQQYCENVSEICVNHTIPSNNKYLTEHGYFGYIFVSADCFHTLLNQELEIEGKKYFGIAAMPITKEELQIKNDHGIEKLFEFWSEAGKDALTFSSSKIA